MISVWVKSGSTNQPVWNRAGLCQQKALPRKTLKVVNHHENKEEAYEGVAVQELLRRAGVPQNEKLRGSAMATYVLAEAADGYSVLYSLAKLDSDFQDSEVIVADTMNGSPLGEKQAPLRWLRLMTSDQHVGYEC